RGKTEQQAPSVACHGDAGIHVTTERALSGPSNALCSSGRIEERFPSYRVILTSWTTGILTTEGHAPCFRRVIPSAAPPFRWHGPGSLSLRKRGPPSDP